MTEMMNKTSIPKINLVKKLKIGGTRNKLEGSYQKGWDTVDCFVSCELIS